MSEDWLDTSDAPYPVIPAGLPVDPAARLSLATECWARLNEAQKRFLTAFRDAGLNARKANRALRGRDETYSAHNKWRRENTDYATIVRLWLGEVSDEALSRERLLARQDDIVETALTPKPVLHQGIAVLDPRDPTGTTVLEEVEVGAASRANEVLMKAAGLLKDKEIEVNVGVAVQNGPPTLNIQVMPTPPSKIVKRESVVVDAKFTEVPSDEWLDA